MDLQSQSWAHVLPRLCIRVGDTLNSGSKRVACSNKSISCNFILSLAGASLINVSTIIGRSFAIGGTTWNSCARENVSGRYTLLAPIFEFVARSDVLYNCIKTLVFPILQFCSSERNNSFAFTIASESLCMALFKRSTAEKSAPVFADNTAVKFGVFEVIMSLMM